MSIRSLPPSKAAELRIATWMLECGWEVFVPVVDLRETDFVVRPPDGAELIALQVKSTEPGGKNAGQLANKWGDGRAAFTYLIFTEGSRERGVILPSAFFKDRGITTFIFEQDEEGYSRGPVRKMFRPFGFDLKGKSELERAKEFCEGFLRLHRSPPPLPSVPQKPRKTNGTLV